MSKSNKKQNSVKKNPEAERQRKFKYMSIFIIAIMIFSLVGYALFSGGNYSGDGSANGGQDLPLQADVFQNSVTGEKYWGAYVSGQQFVFMDGVEGYDERADLADVAFQVRNYNGILNVYVDENYEASDAVFLIENKFFSALKIKSQRVYEKECNSNTFVFTNNESAYVGDCIVFVASRGDEYHEADILSYHLLKSYFSKE